ncbi:hypothetical protein PCL_01824 [Purpureocillium lilacinum]|nr:hypothetical protein PCL_01824 [Purpureocillium lilacinum]
MLRQDTSTRNSRIRANWYRYIIWAESTQREQWGYIVEETSSQVYLPRAMFLESGAVDHPGPWLDHPQRHGDFVRQSPGAVLLDGSLGEDKVAIRAQTLTRVVTLPW